MSMSGVPAAVPGHRRDLTTTQYSSKIELSTRFELRYFDAQKQLRG